MFTLSASSLRGLMCALGLAIGVAQAAELKSLEDAIESNTAAVTLPASDTGTVTFRNCAEPCAMKSLQVNSQSKFFVGSQQVTAQEFTAFVARKPSQFLMIFHKPGEPVVTRLMVFGQL